MTLVANTVVMTTLAVHTLQPHHDIFYKDRLVGFSLLRQVLYLRYYGLCVFIPVEIFLPAAAQAAGRKTQNRTISDSQITRASLHMRLRVDGFKL